MHSLPRPLREKVRHVTILYDAQCTFCNICRKFVEKRQKGATFIFQDIPRGNTGSIVVEPTALKLKKFQACLYIAKNLEQPWPVVALLLGIIPTKIGDWGYDWVSRHRDVLTKLIPSRYVPPDHRTVAK